MINRRKFLQGAALGVLVTLPAKAEDERIRPKLNDGKDQAFKHGVASGDPFGTSVIIWTRLTVNLDKELRIKWHVSTDPLIKVMIKSGENSTNASRITPS